MKSRLLPMLGFLLVVATGGAILWNQWTRGRGLDDQAQSPLTGAGQPSDRVTLAQEKIAAAGLKTTATQNRSLGRTTTVPGRLQYEETRHVELTVATPGVITDIRVKTGDTVSAGQVVAVLNSPEVGDARADILLRQSQRQLAQEQCKWDQATCYGLEQLAQAIQQRVPIDELRERFAKVTLGAARDTVLTAYSRLRLAEQLAAAVDSTAASDVLPGRTIQQRTSERHSAAAALEGVVEQSLFDARQRSRQAENALADAERRLQISQQHLTALLGLQETEGPLQPEDLEPSHLSRVEVRAPFAGTIERCVFAVSERVQVGDSLFVLADTSRLWVAADLREGEWGALALNSGDLLSVSVAALPEASVPAHVHFVGREVDPQTNAIPLIATIDNRQGRLRPGMFVRVTVPLGEVRQVLAVPEGAIVQHETKPFVFVQLGDQEYRRVDVATGVSQDGWIEITAGLSAGDVVVSEGAFYLKSELLLETEAE